jgi:hypothetical protein
MMHTLTMTMTRTQGLALAASAAITITVGGVISTSLLNTTYHASQAHAYASTRAQGTYAVAYEDPTVVAIYVPNEDTSKDHSQADPIAVCLLAHGYTGNPNDHTEAIYAPPQAIAECTTEVA